MSGPKGARLEGWPSAPWFETRRCATLFTMRKLGPGTIVQTIQNGLGSPEIVAPILGADRIAIGVVGGFGASIRALATQ